MIIGWCFICAFALLINKVCLQVTVQAVIGGSAVLPCSSAKRDLKPQDINVHWRDKDSEIVCDLIKGEVKQKDQRYKNRVQTFPNEYERGNFSIKLINLTHADAGEFICFITHSSHFKQDTVQLIINETTAESGNPSTEVENEVPQSDWWKILLISVGLLLSVIIFLSIAYFIKSRSRNGVI